MNLKVREHQGKFKNTPNLFEAKDFYLIEN